MLPKMPSVKEQLHNIADSLPEQATWDEVLDAVFTCRAIARGLADVEAGRTIPQEQVKDYLAQQRKARETTVD